MEKIKQVLSDCCLPKTLRLPLVLLSVVLTLFMACGSDSDTANQVDASSIDPVCEEATQRSDLAWIQQEIFTPSCASFTACHSGAASQARGLNLESGMAQDNLVSQASVLFPQFNLVEPGDANNSYLMVILGDQSGPLANTGTMPLNSPLLCVEKRQAIRRWIDSL